MRAVSREEHAASKITTVGRRNATIPSITVSPRQTFRTVTVVQRTVSAHPVTARTISVAKIARPAVNMT